MWARRARSSSLAGVCFGPASQSRGRVAEPAVEGERGTELPGQHTTEIVVSPVRVRVSPFALFQGPGRHRGGRVRRTVARARQGPRRLAVHGGEARLRQAEEWLAVLVGRTRRSATAPGGCRR